MKLRFSEYFYTPGTMLSMWGLPQPIHTADWRVGTLIFCPLDRGGRASRSGRAKKGIYIFSLMLALALHHTPCPWSGVYGGSSFHLGQERDCQSINSITAQHLCKKCFSLPWVLVLTSPPVNRPHFTNFLVSPPSACPKSPAASRAAPPSATTSRK